MNTDNQNVIISIIGMGPRGLNIFERIHSHCLNNDDLKKKNIILQIFNDNDQYGAGCHDVTQSENLLVNTICSQITTFSDETVANYNFALKGPSFYEWLQDKYRHDYNKKIDPLAYYSRKDLGEYLCWSFNYIYSIKVNNLRVFKIKSKVRDIVKNNYTSKWNLMTDEERYISDFVFLTTGHDNNYYSFANDRKFYAYPLERLAKTIRPEDTVAIQGLGLTTVDVISDLTENRGGIFIEDKNKLKYIPSGREPKMVAFSRSGLPLNARGVSQKELREQYKPRIFTRNAVLDLKKQGKNDFKKDYLPLILQEMEYVYTFTYLKKTDNLTAYHFLNEYLINPDRRDAIVKEYIPNAADRFNWQKISQPLEGHSFKTQEDYGKWLLSYLQEDVNNALEGNVINPVKACTDCLRDIRDLIRLSIDYANLSEESANWFNSEFIPVMIRICVGPPLHRIQQMIALVEAGLLQIDLGPNVTVEEKGNHFYLKTQFNTVIETDYYIVGKVYTPSVEKSQDNLMNSLLKNNLGSQFKINNYRFGQFNVNRDFNLINADNEVIDSIYALGVPTEGAKFYTYILPRPYVNSTALYDAEVCVSNMFSHLTHAHEAL